MESLDVIMSRRSIRRFTEQPLTREQLDIVVRAAMAAPSAGNQQPWRFVVVTDRPVLAQLAEATPYSKLVADCAAAIVVCGDTREEKHPGYWVQDCSAATQNALLAVNGLGLGAVWIGVHPISEREANVAGIIGAPQGVRPLGMIAIGHPAEEKPPAERYEPAFVHSNHWGG